MIPIHRHTSHDATAPVERVCTPYTAPGLENHSRLDLLCQPAL